MLADNKALSPKLRSFQQGVEGLASLLGDGSQATEITPTHCVCSGAEKAMAIAKDENQSFDQGAFRKGAEAVATLLSNGGEQHRAQVQGFCEGANTTMSLISGEDCECSEFC